MNLYRYEFKSLLKSLITWTTVMIIIMSIYMLGIYKVFINSVDDLVAMTEGFPEEFMKAFGFDMLSMFNYGGFYNFTYVYIALIGGIMAVLISLTVFAREKRVKCMDFLLTKPISRKKIFGIKALACISIIILSDLFYIIGFIIVYFINEQSKDSAARFILASAGIFFTQILFMAMGIFWAAYAKKIRSISGTATSFGFFAFILTALANIVDEKAMYLIAPLKYFEPIAVIENGHFELKYVIMAMAILLFCISASYLKYCRSDVRAV